MVQTDKVLARILRGNDLELHVKLTEVEGEQLINVREYIPSREFYGRGVLFPVGDAQAVVDGILAAKKRA